MKTLIWYTALLIWAGIGTIIIFDYKKIEKGSYVILWLMLMISMLYNAFC